MKKKKENIVSYSVTELRAMEAAGKSGSDWERAAKMPVPDGSDPDDAIPDDNEDDTGFWTTELPLPRRKEHTNLRIDADVMDYFRKQGKGFHTKINAVLRSYVEQMRHQQTR